MSRAQPALLRVADGMLAVSVFFLFL